MKKCRDAGKGAATGGDGVDRGGNSAIAVEAFVVSKI